MKYIDIIIIVGVVLVFCIIGWAIKSNAKYVECQYAGELYGGVAHRINRECYVRVDGEVKSWNELHKLIEPKEE